MSKLAFLPIGPDNLEVFERLFEARGGPKYCWCMAWRDMQDRQKATSAERKRAITSMARKGPIGVVACDGGEPVGWCSVAPRETHRRMWPEQDDGERGVWSITCFYVPRARRGEGLARALLDAAVRRAFDEGAAIVEAYPVDPDSPSYRFMGYRQMFSARGFEEVATAGSRRHVMRLARDRAPLRQA